MVNPFKDTNWNPDTAARRSFAKSLVIGFPILAIVFSLLGFWRTGSVPTWTPWLAGIGAGLGVVFWLVPQIAKPFYLAWYFLACCMGIVISNLLLMTFYYTVITPIGLIMRLLGRDPMERRLDRSATTYWVDAEKSVEAERYFRQF